MSSQVVCTSCGESFECGEEQKHHYKSERHMYNVKRKLENLVPIPADVWTKKLARFAELRKEMSRKTDHLKHKNKPKKKTSENEAPEEPSTPEKTEEPTESKEAESKVTGSKVVSFKEEAKDTHLKCLFDTRQFKCVADNLDYMRTKYSFIIPEMEYCTNVNGLLAYLDQKVNCGFQCLYCDRPFKTHHDVRQHMLDKNHTRIGTEGYTRKGNYSEEITNELQEQLEEFYDFRTSFKELNIRQREAGDALAHLRLKNDEEKEKLEKEKTTPEGQLKEIFEFFDDDKDGNLNYEEAEQFYLFYTDETMELTEKDYANFTKNFNGKFLLKSLIQFYQLAEKDVAEDYRRFREDWADADIIECADEEEFAEICKAYGLRQARILPNGNLLLPDGSTAPHRSLNYIYRQRGPRLDEAEVQRRKEQKALSNGVNGRSNLMLRNGGNGDQIAMSTRETKRQGKQMIAVLKYAQKKEMQRGEKQNVLQKKHSLKIRSIRGDMAGGR